MSIANVVTDQNVQASLVEDCVKLIDEQVAAKNGISGMALKAAYGVVKGVEPGYISNAVQRLLPSILNALDPMWAEGVQAGDPVQYLTEQRSRTADMVLSITDAKIERSKNGAVRASYGQFRKSVKGDVENAVPGLAKILGTHIQG
jgi:hypothetical protein